MPAKSKSQQSAAGMALAAKRGEIPASSLKGAARDMYDSMSEKQLRDFAKTSSKDLPQKVKKEDIVGQIAALIEDVPDAPDARDTEPPSEVEIQFLRRKMDKCSTMLEEYFHRLPVINPNRLGPGNPGYGMAHINSILGDLIDHLTFYIGKADDQI